MNQSPAHHVAWSEEAFRRFWKRMGDVFGLRWYEQNGPEPTSSWKNGLSQYQVADVLAAVVGYETTSHSGFPPNLPQFLEEIRAARRRAIPPDRALPAPKKTPEQIERMLDGLKPVRAYTVKWAEKYKPRKPDRVPVMNDEDFERRKQ